MPQNIIEIKNLSKKYQIRKSSNIRAEYLLTIRDEIKSFIYMFKAQNRTNALTDFWALQDVSFDIKAGEKVALIGANGAGKSTLLKLLSQITFPNKGEIILRGQVASLLEVGSGFNGELTGRENIYLNGAILGMKRQEITDKLGEIVDFAQIQAFLDTPYKHYSSGMSMRLAFAVAAFLEPEILLIDEVLAVGDMAFQRKSLQKMQEISQKDGKTIVFVSHDLAAIRHLCERGIYIESGKIVYDGPIDQAIEKYLHHRQKELTQKQKQGKFTLNSPDKTGLIAGQIYVNEKPNHLFKTGDNLKIEISYNNDIIDLNSDTILSLSLKNPLGQIIIKIDNFITGEQLVELKKIGVHTIDIPNFNLYGQGEFYFDLEYGHRGEITQTITDAFYLEIIPTNIYQSPKMPATNQNYFAPQIHFK